MFCWAWNLSHDGREQRRLAGYARDAIQILEHSRALYAQGQVYFYRVAAVQLRLLLCDTVRRHGKMTPASVGGAPVARIAVARVG